MTHAVNDPANYMGVDHATEGAPPPLLTSPHHVTVYTIRHKTTDHLTRHLPLNGTVSVCLHPTPLQVIFTYDVIWEESDTQWANR